MKTLARIGIALGVLLCMGMPVKAQQLSAEAVAKADGSRMEYVYSLEQARRSAYQQKKPIFINCYAAWATPCRAMDKYVFSDPEFCKFMAKNFVNLWVDMKSKEGKELKKEYRVGAYPAYLVIDYKGGLVQRVSGGGKLPGFKEKVELALSSKTSLAGTQAKYLTGKYSSKELYNYMRALEVADEDSLFQRIAREYMATITPEAYPEKKNWLLRYVNRDREGEYYRYLIAHKAAFVKNMGEEAVNSYIESILCPEVQRYATGDVEYDAEALETLHRQVQEACLPDTSATVVVYGIAKRRGERKYADLLQYMRQEGKYLDKYYSARSNIELTFNFPDMTDADRKAVVEYLQERAVRESGAPAERLKGFVAELQKGNQGIVFTHDSFAELLAKAKAEGKRLFIDCYTTWCGPCRAMASSVFPHEEVGSYFNAHFVCAKIDMEKGEGVELAKKYGVNAFPTLLFLDPEGNVLEKSIGYKSAERLLEVAKGVR